MNTMPPQEPDPFMQHFSNFEEAANKLFSSMILGYSRRFNQRRLEFPFYATWDILLNVLFIDITLLIVPQHKLFIHEDVYDDMHSVMSFQTVPGHVPEVVTDFAVVRTWFSPPVESVDFDLFRLWNHSSLVDTTAPVLVEIKRSAPRHISEGHFSLILPELFVRAFSQAELQAAFLFRDAAYKHQHQVVLIVAVGEWWSWRLMSKAQTDNPDISYKPHEPDGDGDEYIPSSSESDSDNKPGPSRKETTKPKAKAKVKGKAKGKGKGKAKGKGKGKAREEDKARMDEEMEMDEKQARPVWRYVDLSIPNDGRYAPEDLIAPHPTCWSAPIVLGSPLSNRRLWQLREDLKNSDEPFELSE